jgi:adenylate cyclase class 2
MSDTREIEIKFRIESIPLLMEKMQTSGFHQVTGRTHEMNTLYDFPEGQLRRRGALLRVRQYGDKWTVTYKDRSAVGPGHHKIRREIETSVGDGPALAGILGALGFKPGFVYEKFRSEWTESQSELGGHLVIDETPIGDFGEIEGSPQWIDSVASRLGISQNQYITASYAELFIQWREKTGSQTDEMRFPL